MDNPESSSDVPRPIGWFHTTHWSVVLKAGQEPSPQRAEALEKLCRVYWHPIYAFARRKGAGEEDAKDLTQQFFSLLLQRNDFAGIDPHKGKFRTFLLASFTHFLANDRDRAGALKRGGGKVILSLDELSSEQLARFEPATEGAPSESFDLRWALTVLDQALVRLKDEMFAGGKARQLELLQQFLAADAGAGEYDAVAQKLGAAESSVAVLVHRLRQRYRELVRAEVAQTVSSPTELEEEMHYLFRVLNHAP